MSEDLPITKTKASGGRRGRRVLVALMLVLSVAAVVSWWWKFTSTEEFRHGRVRQRIEAHIRPVLLPMTVGTNPKDRLSKSDRARCEVLSAIFAALGNWPLYYPKNTEPGKLAAIADRLDATNGADLQTFEGCAELLVLFDDASPTFRDYPWVTTLYEMADEGRIPPLPKLKAR